MKLFLLLISFCYLNIALAQSSTNLLLAKQFAQNQDYEKALDIYEKLFNNSPQPEIYNGYLDALIHLKKYNEAHKVLKKLIKKNPTNPQYSIDKAQLCFLEKKDEDGNEVLYKLIDNLPANAEKITELAQLFIQKNYLDFALQTFQKGQKILNNRDAFFQEIIAIYVKKKDLVPLCDEFLERYVKNTAIENFFRSTIEQMCVNAQDYDIVKIATLKHLQKNPEFIPLNELLIWIMLQKREFSAALIQIISLDKRLGENGRRVYQNANVFFSNEAYNDAIKSYQYLLDKGKANNPFYVAARTGILDVRNQKVQRGIATPQDYADLEKDYQQVIAEFGKGIQTLSAMKNLAYIQAYHLDKFEESITLLDEIIQMPNLNPRTRDELKLELGDVSILNDEPWEAALLYGQVEKSQKDNELGHEAMFRNAKLAFYNGDFEWANSQLKILKGGTSQLIANDALDLSSLLSENKELDSLNAKALSLYAKAELHIFKARYNNALLYLDTLSNSFPNHSLADENLMSRSKIALAKQDWLTASNTLGKIIESYYYDTLADDALFMLAELQETHLNDKENAKLNYQKLLIDFPASVHVVNARKRFRILRGDIVKTETD